MNIFQNLQLYHKYMFESLKTKFAKSLPVLRAGELAPLRVAPSWVCRSLGIAFSSSVGRGRGDFRAFALESSASFSSILPLVPLSGDGVVLVCKALLLLFQEGGRERERERAKKRKKKKKKKKKKRGEGQTDGRQRGNEKR